MIKYQVLPLRNMRTNQVKYYAQIANTNPVNLDVITELVQAQSTVSAADVKAVLDQLQVIVQEQLRNGRSIRLGDLGSFRPTLSSTRSDTAAAVKSKNIKRVNVVFVPSAYIQKDLKNGVVAGGLKFMQVKKEENIEEGGEA